MASSSLYALAFLAAITAFAVKADDSCPPSQDIAPCTCDGEGFSCLGKIGIEQIRKAFKANFKYGGVKSLWVQATPITSVPADLFNNIKVQEAYIEMNEVTTIDLKSLMGSKDTLWILSFFGNKLTSFDYDTFPSFDIMTTLNLGKNSFTTIPDNSFKSFFLRNLILAQNQISSIGTNAFFGLDNIAYIDLSGNRLRSLGPYSMALKSQLPQLNLMSNEIASVDATAFDNTTPQVLRLAANKLTSLTYDAFGTLITRMGQYQGLIDVSANPFTCKGCDYKWVATNKAILIRVILGFACPDGSDLHSLNEGNIGC